MADKYQLTSVEQELMQILWDIKEGTVHDVLAKLPKNRKLAYTSVSTILRILQEKNILMIKKVGRQHIYLPKLSKETFASHSIHKIVTKIFSGNSVQLVNYLVDKNRLSLQEINDIQKLLDEKKKELAE